MSATADINVAVRYSMGDNSVILRLASSSFMKCGADISYLSAFPGESEYLYPPLTYLMPTGKTLSVPFKGRTFTVVEVRPMFGS